MSKDGSIALTGVPADILQAARILWDFHGIEDDPGPADAIIGLGSYDLRVAQRCAELYRLGWSRRVIFTGASGHWTRDLFEGSEAEAFAAHAEKAGVPAGAIALERSATNIGENVVFTARMLPGARAVIIVTKPQTRLRCRATVDRQWPGVRAMITAPPTAFADQPVATHDLRALICEMVGDLERLRTYPALGFQAEVQVPGSVLSAFIALKNAGYTDHLPRQVRD